MPLWLHCNYVIQMIQVIDEVDDITDYQISSNNSNSQQQPTAGYRQTSKLLLGMSQLGLSD